ncbi:hypothetical protein HPB50_000450 [Hyalomma asiaticum]|uniref:Uncharacterized protein n=1 Tax=Hyalomma asiaticum TaxID=266040 RepID=A0ACB7TCP9_HYAAI|nr:hypothetical protein HPB50_000450 [Hyalomma asiaticum]
MEGDKKKEGRRTHFGASSEKCPAAWSSPLRASIVGTPPTYGTTVMEPADLLLPKEHMLPFDDGVQAFLIAHGRLLLRNIFHVSQSDNIPFRAQSAPEPRRDAVRIPSDKEPAAGRTVTMPYFSDCNVGSVCGSPDSDAELLHTIGQH